jgi:2-deoxy-D-gluconate 3-dehydrogenase
MSGYDLTDLTGKEVLITGATGRIGRALAAGFVEHGAHVILTARSESKLAALRDGLGHDRAAVRVADLTTEVGVNDLFDALEAGLDALDVLITCAAQASPKQFGSLRSRDFEEVFALNVIGVFLCVQRAVALMERAGAAKVLNVGSIYGSVAVDRRLYADAPEMIQGSAPYIASKSALVNLTRDLAVLLAPRNIQVNMMSPGGIYADQPRPFVVAYESRTPLGRMAVPSDVVGTALYLCSAASDYVTGQTIMVDGGFTAW